MTAFNALTLILAFFSYVIIYNKSVKNSVNKKDVEDSETKMKNYVDSQDRAIHHRIDGIEKKTSEDIAHIRTMTQEIYNHLLK